MESIASPYMTAAEAVAYLRTTVQAIEPLALRRSTNSIGDAMSVEERLEKIESALILLVQRQMVKDWYTTEEFARLVGKAEFTVREWCRHGRINAEKRISGRGAFPAWVISHQELLRYQRQGLLPFRS
jgi:hypothetical protein